MLALAQRLPVCTQTTCCSFNQSRTQRLHHRDNQQLCLLLLEHGEEGGGEGGGGEAGDGAEETEEETGDSGSEEGQLTQFMCDDATMRRATGREVGQGVWCHWGGWVGG